MYLLTVVDQKNLISRHGREREAYKNTVFTSLIRSQAFTPMGTKLSLSSMHMKIQNTNGSIVVMQYKKTGTITCHMRYMPRLALHASFLSLSGTQAQFVLLLLNAYVVRV